MVMWVFGYGSLVWNPGFHYDEKVLGFIKGYKRVFDLGKALGTPEHPARTCTLEKDEEAICWGTAFCVRGGPEEERLAMEKMVMWVFGYGSLVWNPGFHYDKKVLGFIKGYKRVFDLGKALFAFACIDHRGTPEHPARTCTLEKDEEAICWGTAFCVRGGPEEERLAMEYLERRECEYDLKTCVDFYKEDDPLNPAVTGVMVFTSTPDKVSNKYYLGPAPLEDMAR
ncbi:hypothetical protein F2Q70_00013599 [Brassica cretica]|uniref:Gamma-glutamylcyclotransferase n=1 Tax=Brassica cretica TaxID=69181 RepID=A0A8S9M5G7_BRACR|nr:hypothetical protein F2Q70_00013599 [Brassica cretica]